MQKIIKTTRHSFVSSSSDFLSTLALRLTRWLSAPPTQHRGTETATRAGADAPARRRAGEPIGSVSFDGERLGGWPGEGRIR